MFTNVFEETILHNNRLPLEWQSQESLDDLEAFLQSNWEQRSAFYEDGHLSTRQQFLTMLGHRSARTNNYIGTIVFKGQQLNIFPKVFRTDRYDTDTSDLSLEHLMSNLVKWIDYCGKIDYPYINISGELNDQNNLRDLFVTLYIRYVKSALERGTFYQYEEQVEDIRSIKGKLDLPDYLLHKYPNGKIDSFRCSFSEFRYDNLLNQIIKCTCRLLMGSTTPENQKILRSILIKMSDVTDRRCGPHECDKVRLSKLQRHYSIILSMSKMFLLNRTTSYDIDNHESFCFLFPTELLFEGFVGGFIRSVISEKAKTTLQASDTTLIEDTIINGVSYGKAYQQRNDILIETNDGRCFVLDTKYKQLDRIESSHSSAIAIQQQVSESDIRQVLSYALKRNLSEAYLLYPVFRYESLDEKQEVSLVSSISVDGMVHNMIVHIIRIPFIFEKDIEIRDRLRDIIEEMIA